MKLLISKEDLSSLETGGEALYYSLYELSEAGWYKLSLARHSKPHNTKDIHVALLCADKEYSDGKCMEPDPDIIVVVKADSDRSVEFQIQHVFTCGLHRHLTVILYTFVQFSRSVFHKLYIQDVNSYNFIPLVGSAYPCKPFPHLYDWCFYTMYATCRIFTGISNLKKFQNKLRCVGEICEREVAIQQLRELDGGHSADLCDCVKRLRFQVYLLQLLVNSILGIITLCIVFFYGPAVSGVVRSHTEYSVRSMLSLLEWMMGVPAGLKLNYRLTIFLGKFFSYHVYLWAGYLGIVSMHFELMMKAIVSIGAVGGLSLQVALLQDLIDLLTLHLFCFYIYSCRLYSLVIHALLSLSRLLRGLKWNSLRQRVDHASYDVTQLLIGTLVFSILLFLLPTVFLYYSVFTMFRLVVMTIQLCLTYLRSWLNYHFILLRILAVLNSNWLNCDIHLTINNASGEELTVLEVDKVTAAPYSRSVNILRFPTAKPSPSLSPSEGTFIQKLSKGTIL